jgi:hypothetical protein
MTYDSVIGVVHKAFFCNDIIHGRVPDIDNVTVIVIGDDRLVTVLIGYLGGLVKAIVYLYYGVAFAVSFLGYVVTAVIFIGFGYAVFVGIAAPLDLRPRIIGRGRIM